VRILKRKQSERLPIHFKQKKIAIATPTGDLCHTAYATSVVQMVAYSMMHAPGLGILYMPLAGAVLPLSRQLLVMRARESGATHILFIDSDMEFPQDLMLRLARHDVPIVAANCISRRPPFLMTARTHESEVITRPESQGLEKVERVGFGVILIDIHVFERVPLPWFEFAWLGSETACYRGEDYGFCDKARAHGFEIHIDHDVSQQIGHVGTFAYYPQLKSRASAVEAAQSRPE